MSVDDISLPARQTDTPPSRPGVELVYRFALELALLAGLGYWGWHIAGSTPARMVMAALLPAVAAIFWGLFVSPRARVAVPGALQLIVEVALFGLAAYGIWTSGSRAAAETLLTAVGLHYVLSWERIVWLLRHCRRCGTALIAAATGSRSRLRGGSASAPCRISSPAHVGYAAGAEE